MAWAEVLCYRGSPNSVSLAMSIASTQYDVDEKLAMARAVLRWSRAGAFQMKRSNGFSTARGGLRRCSASIAHCDAYSLTAIGLCDGSVRLTRPLMEPARSISYWQMASRVCSGSRPTLMRKSLAEQIGDQILSGAAGSIRNRPRSGKRLAEAALQDLRARP